LTGKTRSVLETDIVFRQLAFDKARRMREQLLKFLDCRVTLLEHMRHGAERSAVPQQGVCRFGGQTQEHGHCRGNERREFFAAAYQMTVS
jgi:hypothetical protein